MITIVLLFIPLLLLSSVVYWSVRNGISPTPSSHKQVQAILQTIPSDIKGRIYETGSGWGTLAIALAKEFPDCPVIGLENSPLPYVISKLLALVFGLKNLTFMYANFLSFPIQDASAVVCYLYPGGVNKLKPRLEELRRGTLVISNTFSIQGWTPIEIKRTNDLYRSPIYVYRV